MRHRVRSRKLGRTSAHRKAMYRNMVTSLLDHERIQTTDAKAKEVRRLAERMITLGKRGGLHARRNALRVIRRREVAAKVFDELADRYRDRPGGYTRVVKLGPRAGDAAPLSVVELLQPTAARSSSKKKAASGKAAKESAGGKKTAKKATRKPAAKKAASKKAASKKPASKKPASKKAASKKRSTSKKAASKKAASKKGGTRKKADR
jgi:large subunit ribosomal protein L17